MKKNKGFTLIELLAVIVILAIIALISTPIIIGVIEKARKGAFEDSAYGVIDAGRIYFVDKIADQNKFEGATFTFPEGGDLKISGEKPEGGTLSLDSTGKQAIALYDKDKKWCALKTYDEEKITIKEYKKEECKVSKVLIGAAKTIIDKNIEGNTEGLFTDDFGNIRYRGNNNVVKNYVTFNNEVWRIIGVFDGKVKLIRDERIPNPNDQSIEYDVTYPDKFLWNSKNIGDWTTSDLKDYLNSEYYNDLVDTAKNMIEETKYNLGGITLIEIDKKTAYELERGTIVYTGRPTEWTGKIGLTYLSDYGYSASLECTQNLRNYSNAVCKENNWLFQDEYAWWLLTTWSNISSSAAVISHYGYAQGDNVGKIWRGVRPTLYLKSTVKIIGGDGTNSNPYQLSM